MPDGTLGHYNTRERGQGLSNPSRRKKAAVSAIAAIAGIALFGCGGTHQAATRTVTQVGTIATTPPPTPTQETGFCIITGAGTKLCGEDAEAWCEANAREVACAKWLLVEKPKQELERKLAAAKGGLVAAEVNLAEICKREHRENEACEQAEATQAKQAAAE